MVFTHRDLISTLRYEQDTGAFFLLVDHKNRKSGTRIDVEGANGYRSVFIFGKTYPSHRLAWFYLYGEWPSNQIDHKNLSRSDNRSDNLRSATPEQNNYNRGSWSNTGFRGVSRNGKKFVTTAKINGVMKSFSFPTFEEARDFYIADRSAIAGEFLRTDMDHSVVDRIDGEKLMRCRNCSMGYKCNRHKEILVRLGPINSANREPGSQ